MFRSLIWYVNFAFSILGKIPKMYKIKKLIAKQGIDECDNYIYEIASKWAKDRLKVSGATINVHGIENIPQDGAVVFISNHQSNFDFLIFMSYIPKSKGFIAKVELEKIPFLRTWMNYIRCVFMDRSSLKKSVAAIVEGVKIIKQGHSLVIFPEGTRSNGGPMIDFKAGSFKLATKAKAPIVPITIDGSYKLCEGNNNRIKPATVDVYIHPAIETSNLSKEDAEILPKKVHEIVKSKLSN